MKHTLVATLEDQPSTLNRVGEVDADGKPAYVVRYTLTKEGPATVVSGDFECEDKRFALRANGRRISTYSLRYCSSSAISIR